MWIAGLLAFAEVVRIAPRLTEVMRIAGTTCIRSWWICFVAINCIVVMIVISVIIVTTIVSLGCECKVTAEGANSN